MSVQQQQDKEHQKVKKFWDSRCAIVLEKMTLEKSLGGYYGCGQNQ